MTAITIPTSGQTITFPDGDVEIDTPFVLSEQIRTTVKGGQSTRLIYTGPPCPAPVILARCMKCQLTDFNVVVAADGVDAGVLITNLPGTSPHGWISTGNQLTRIDIEYDQNGHSPRFGFNIDSTALDGADGNNDVHGFDECYARVFSEAGFRQNGSQVHQIVYNRCRAFNSNGWGGIGLLCDSGAYFTWRDGGMTGCDCDFVTNTGELMGTVDGHDSENAIAFYQSGRQGTRNVFNATNIRWDGLPQPGRPVVDCFGPGPFKINGYFAGIGGVCPTIQFGTYSGPTSPTGSVFVDGLMIRQHGGPFPPGVIASAPRPWEVSSRGFSYEYIQDDGSRIYRQGPLLWNRPVQ